MRALSSFVYGVAAYIACHATLLYFIGFSGNLLVPKSVDVGGSAPWAEALGITCCCWPCSAFSTA